MPILKITDISDTGEGVAAGEGKTVFVDGALPGDIVRVRIKAQKKSYDIAVCEELLEPSIHRVSAPCPYVPECGGCSLMELSYDYQLEWKRRQVENALKRIGGITAEVSPTIGMDNPYGYRNKMTFPIQRGKIGIYKKRSHDLLEVEHCLLQDERMNKALRTFCALLPEFSTYDEATHTGGLRSLLLRRGGEELLLCAVRKEEQDLTPLIKAFPDEQIVENIHLKPGNVLLGPSEKVLQGSGTVPICLEDLCFCVSASSFFQVNLEQLSKVKTWMQQHLPLSEEEIVFDLYGGMGVLGSFVAHRVKEVHVIEIAPSSVKDGIHSAKENGLTNMHFVEGKSEWEMEKLVQQGNHPSTVIVDPPRKGLDESLRKSILKANPKQIFYMSCKPSTLARDLKDFTEHGYMLKHVQPFDFFPHSTHVETCVLLSKLKACKYIVIEIDLDEYDLTPSESEATYRDIKDFVSEQFKINISNLDIAQVKRKNGLIERSNYNMGSGKTKQPQVTKQKEKAIEVALKHFLMI